MKPHFAVIATAIAAACAGSKSPFPPPLPDEYRGHLAIGFGDAHHEFLPCGFGDSIVSWLPVVDKHPVTRFADGVARNDGGEPRQLYFVRWRGRLSPAGHYGHIGMQDHYFDVIEVLQVQKVSELDQRRCG